VAKVRANVDEMRKRGEEMEKGDPRLMTALYHAGEGLPRERNTARPEK
jgi:hypothetical protein